MVIEILCSTPFRTFVTVPRASISKYVKDLSAPINTTISQVKRQVAGIAYIMDGTWLQEPLCYVLSMPACCSCCFAFVVMSLASCSILSIVRSTFFTCAACMCGVLVAPFAWGRHMRLEQYVRDWYIKTIDSSLRHDNSLFAL